MKENRVKTTKIVVLGMLSAIAYILVVLLRIPVVEFLKYEPKDVIIAIGGLLYGPVPALLMAIVVSFVEMFTISDTGPIGLLMNVLASASFACIPALYYQKFKSNSSVIFGFIFGTMAMTLVMILWNYLITPIYMGVPRDAVADMLVPVFLPFNLVKGGINSFISILIYIPLLEILKKSSINVYNNQSVQQIKKSNLLMIIVASAVGLASCIYLAFII